MAFGTCPNADRCTKGASGALIDLYPGLGEICPECGKRLIPQTAAINTGAAAGVASAVGSFSASPIPIDLEWTPSTKPTFIRSGDPAPPDSQIATPTEPFVPSPIAQPLPPAPKLPLIKPIPPLEPAPVEAALAQPAPIEPAQAPAAPLEPPPTEAAPFAPTAMEIAARDRELQAALPKIKPIRPPAVSESSTYDFVASAGQESRALVVLKKIGFWGSGVMVGIACAVVFTSVLPHAMAPASSAIRICASSGVAERLAPDLVKAFLAKNPGSHISVITSSTAQIAAGLSAGRDCQLALAEGTPVRPKQAVAVDDQVVGLDGIVVIVNAANPVRALTMSEIAGIFSGHITNWQTVGGPDQAIGVIAPSEGSDQIEVLRKQILKGAPVTLTARRTDSPSEAAIAVGSDRNAIGLGSFAASDPGVVVRLIGPAHDTIAASTITVGERRYPLTVPVYVARRSDLPDPLIDKFVTFVHSQRGQGVVGSDGFVSSTSL